MKPGTRIEIINTGAELMAGRRLNTHARWLAARLAALGHVSWRHTTVDDSAAAIQDAVRRGLEAADLVITTGGLGPTADDRTRELIAELAGLELREDPEIIGHIETFFRQRQRPVPPNARRQAMVPSGATVWKNSNGTAPGLLIQINAASGQAPPKWLIMLPGPPRELRPMFTERAEPWIAGQFPSSHFHSVILRTTGLGESFLEEKIAGPLQPWLAQGMELALCARPGEVDIHLTALGENSSDLVAEAERAVMQTVGDLVFGRGMDATLEKAVVDELLRARATVAVAESCTGGMLAHRLTNVPGVSEAFLAGWVTYSNRAKQELLGVPGEILEQHGAVSRETAVAMARGARDRARADYALSVTGIAGPGGGTADKPVGTVWIGLSRAGGDRAVKQVNAYDRETFKWVTSQQALEWLRRELGRDGRNA